MGVGWFNVGGLGRLALALVSDANLVVKVRRFCRDDQLACRVDVIWT